MDLDKLKVINDTYGHDCGDQMIKAFADVLKEVLYHEDIIARIGGDEFAAVLQGADRKEAMEISGRIIKTANEKIVYPGAEKNIRLRLSIGICDNEIVKFGDDMLKCADKAMYLAKNKTGNCCLVWEQNVSEYAAIKSN